MSGRKSNLQSFQSVVNGSMAGDIVSAVTDILLLDNIYIECDITGSPSGVLAPEVSSSYLQDSQGNVERVGKWVPIMQPDGTPVQVVIASGSPSAGGFNLNELGAASIRLRYTRTSGTGTLNVYLTGKML